MKTPFLFFGATTILLLVFLCPFAITAQTTNTAKVIDYANSPRPLNASTSEWTPYDSPNFEAWVKLKNNSTIWNYYLDENYRTLVNNWNTTNNPFWAAAITGSQPYGTFDFSAGLSKINLVGNYRNLKDKRYNYSLNPIKQTNIFGQPHYNCKVQTNDNTLADLKNLPTKNPKTNVVNQQVVKQLDFTQHVTPVATSWSQNKGFNKRNRTIASGIQTYISPNQIYYTVGNNGSSGGNNSISSSTSSSSTHYTNYSGSKGLGGSSAISSSSSASKTVSTGTGPSTTTSSN